MGYLVVRIMKLVGMSRGSRGSVAELGFGVCWGALERVEAVLLVVWGWVIRARLGGDTAGAWRVTLVVSHDHRGVRPLDRVAGQLMHNLEGVSRNAGARTPTRRVCGQLIVEGRWW